MNTKAINMTERPRNTVTSHCPEECVQRTGLLTEEVPSGVMRSGSLRDLIVAARLDSVDQIREKDGILDEENGDVVTDNIYY
jgi:hypothetical protein